MSVKLHRFYIGKTAGELSMRTPEWWHHLFAFLFISAALVLSYGLALESVSPTYMAGPLLITVLGLIMLYGGRIEYLHIGEKVKIGIETPQEEENPLTIEDEK